MEEDDDEDQAKAEEDGDDDDAMGIDDQHLPDSNLLNDFQYKFESSLRSSSRGLLVKDLVIHFDPESVYGRRVAFHKALMITVPWPKVASL